MHGRRAIASPVPLKFWRRETIYHDLVIEGDFVALRYKLGDWSLFGGLKKEVTIPDRACGWRMGHLEETLGSEADAFMFWSRSPFLARAPEGSVVLYDARFYDPRARDRFSVALPDVRCEELPRP